MYGSPAGSSNSSGQGRLLVWRVAYYAVFGQELAIDKDLVVLNSTVSPGTR